MVSAAARASLPEEVVLLLLVEEAEVVSTGRFSGENSFADVKVLL